MAVLNESLFAGLLYHGALDDCAAASYNLEDIGSRWMQADTSRVIGTPTGHRHRTWSRLRSAKPLNLQMNSRRTDGSNNPYKGFLVSAPRHHARLLP
jgi:hypothetical protein